MAKEHQRRRHKSTTSKACPFLQIPREIRDIIYRHLLLDIVHGIQPQYYGGVTSGRLHTGIMRTCRKVYEEALAGKHDPKNSLLNSAHNIRHTDDQLLSPVLYSENLFRYKTRSDCIHSRRELGIRIINGQFSKLQKVEIAISPVHCCLYVRDILKMITHIKGLGCRLKTFHLDFCLNDDEGWSSPMRDKPLISEVSGSRVRRFQCSCSR